MSGYVSGVLAIFCVNLVFAYGIFVTAAAGQINLLVKSSSNAGSFIAPRPYQLELTLE